MNFCGPVAWTSMAIAVWWAQILLLKAAGEKYLSWLALFVVVASRVYSNRLTAEVFIDCFSLVTLSLCQHGSSTHRVEELAAVFMKGRGKDAETWLWSVDKCKVFQLVCTLTCLNKISLFLLEVSWFVLFKAFAATKFMSTEFLQAKQRILTQA